MQDTAENFTGPEQMALANFAVLLDDINFAEVLDLAGISRLKFLLRRQMSIEFTGLYIALWRLALAHSFPGQADSMFAAFLDNYLKTHTGKTAAQITERATQYWAMLQPAGDSNFNEVARHLTSFLVREQNDAKAPVLKLALHIRRAYKFIFARLI